MSKFVKNLLANEVKSLATQTAKATQDISEQITQIQGVTGEAVEAIEAIGKTIAGVSEVANAIAATVVEQGSATKEIASNAGQASDAMNGVAGHVAEVNQVAQRSGETARTTLEQASALWKQADNLNREFTSFLEEVGQGWEASDQVESESEAA